VDQSSLFSGRDLEGLSDEGERADGRVVECRAVTARADHQPHPVQAAGAQRAQELGPKCAGLAVTDRESQHLTASLGRDAGGDHHRLGGDAVVQPGLAVGGVQEHVREDGVVQGALRERVDFLVQLGTDPRDLRLGDPGVGPPGL
jgi:hypothetical protein